MYGKVHHVALQEDLPRYANLPRGATDLSLAEI
jgi:hypothetical protein